MDETEREKQKQPEKASRSNKRDGFWQYYLKNSLVSIRYALVLTMILYAAFGFLDLNMAPSAKSQIWVIRFAFVIPGIGIALGLTYRKVFRRLNHGLLFGVSIISSSGILLMIFLVKRTEPAYEYYYGGLILSIYGTHSLLRLRHSLALISTFLTFLGYNFIVIIKTGFFNEQSIAVLVNNNFFLIGAGVLGFWASKTTELMFRKDYDNQQLLIREKKALIATKEKLQESDSIKNRLISIISHDIRSPIASLSGIIKMVENKMMTEDELNHQMSRIGKTLEGTNAMLNNLLSWSLTQIKNKGVRKGSIKLSPLVEEVFAALGAQAQVKQNQLLNLVPDELKIYAEQNSISLVLGNLVSNAVKFTESGVIKVFCEEDNGSMKVSVSDTGLGISEDSVRKLFDWNIRSTTKGTRNESGSGIGLVVCKESIERQGGKLQCNTKLGQGTTFTFSLPNNVRNPIPNPASSV